MSKDYSRKEVIDIVEQTAAKHGIPKDDFLRASYIETGGKFDEHAYNKRTGAAGLYQFMPDVAPAYGLRGDDVYNPVKNAEAAAKLYENNQKTIVASHDRTHRPYLSGAEKPNGLDMYLAHQQGAGGYTSIQAAINTGQFLDMKPKTRTAILSNVDGDDLQKITGVSKDQLRAMSDKDMAQTFVGYWKTKYERISIPEVGIAPLAAGTTQAKTSPEQPHAPKLGGQGGQSGQGGQGGQEGHWPAPGNFKINEADKPGEGRGEHNSPRSNRSGRHTGVDIQGNEGDRIEPFAAGRVVFAGVATGYGNTVVIDHGNGERTLYAHLKSISVEKDQMVTTDTKIGAMGRTGNTPKEGDTHLHFEIRHGAKDGQPFSGRDVDPMPYLKHQKQIDGTAVTAAGALADGKLSSGEKGAEVESLQKKLNALGYTDAAGQKLGEDGKYGKHTKEGVEQFQRENGLTPSGVADAATLKLVDKGMTRHAAADGALQPGEKGPDVRGLQENLSKLGYHGLNDKPITVDGDYGKNTQAAVSAFQKANGLPETGTADKATLDKVGSLAPGKFTVDAEARVNPPQVPPTTGDKPQTQPTPTDKPQAPANAQPTPTDKPQTPPSSNTTVPPPTQTDKPLMSNPNHPDNKLYQQAVSNLEQLGPSGGFKSREDLEKAAAAVAADAKATGLKEIDHVSKTNAPNGQSYLVAVQGDPTSPASKSSYIDYGQATSQTVTQSTQMAEALKPAVQQAQQPAQVDQTQNPAEQRTARSQ